jgi:Holliday junction resolvasome RuvABC endonuclease subunit
MVAQAKRYTRSLVVDQSTTCTGWAIVEHDPYAEVSYGTCGKLIAHGVMKSKHAAPIARMSELHQDIIDAYKHYGGFDEIVYEDTAPMKQRSEVTNEAMAGAIISIKNATQDLGVKLYKQNPSTIKKRFTGNGHADKEAIMAAVVTNWGIPRKDIKDDNHADSLAAAYVWLNMADELRAKAKEKKVKKK